MASRHRQAGGWWVAEEALAIAVYCSLVARDDFARGAWLAVNHSGDSDSTGAIAANVLGAIFSCSSIPERWVCSATIMMADAICSGCQKR